MVIHHNMKKIVITGGSGFIGGHIVEFLLKKNFKVDVIDLWESPEIKSFKKKYNSIKFHKLNFLKFEKFKKILRNKDALIHMAAILGTSETITTYDVEDVVRTNVLGTTKVLKICKELKIKKVLIPTTPDVTWLNPYKITKQAIERLAQLFNKEYNLNVRCLKLGNIYGSRERWLEANQTDIKAPFNYQKIIPSFIMDHLNKKPITIYGDGKQKSEYIFIDDVVMSFYLSLKTKKRFGTEVIHVGRGKNNSVVDIINALEKAWGIKFKRKFVKMRPGEHKIQIKLNPKPLKKYLNYSLQWNLVEGLKKTIPYYIQQYKISKK